MAQNICRYTSICDFWALFGSYLFVRAPFAQTLTEINRGRPSGYSRRGLGSIGAVCRARRALNLFFSVWVDKTISRVFYFRRYLVPRYYPPFSKWWCFFAHTYHMISLWNRHGLPQLWVRCAGVQGQAWGTLSSMFGRAAYRVPCVTRACTVCNAMFFFSIQQKKSGCRSINSLGVTFWVEDARSSRGKRSFVCLFFFFFSHLFSLWRFSQCCARYVSILVCVPPFFLELHGSPQSLEELLQDTARKYGCEYCSTNVARACNFFDHTQVCEKCFVIYYQEQKKKWWENVIFTVHVLSRLTELLTWAASLGWTSAVTCCNIYREYHAPVVFT